MTDIKIDTLGNGSGNDVFMVEKQPRDAVEIITDIIKYLKENTDIANQAVEELNDCTGFLYENELYPMDELPDMMNGVDILELLRMTYFGRDDESWHLNKHGEKVYESSFNPMRDYFYFDGYGNLVSCNSFDYRDYIDIDVVREMTDNREYIDAIKNDAELSEMFDELEEAIAQ